MRTPADNGGGEVKNLQNFADVFYGWPLVQKQLPRKMKLRFGLVIIEYAGLGIYFLVIVFAATITIIYNFTSH